MSKKGYQKRLPTVLPPSPPAPRRSPESDDREDSVAPIAPTAPARPPAKPAARVVPGVPSDPAQPQTSDARPPIAKPPTPVAKDRTRLSRPAVVVIVLVNLAAAGFLAFSLLGDRPAPRGDASADRTDALRLGANESYVDTEVLPNGDVVVHHWIRTVEPFQRLRLALPRLPGGDDLSATGVEVMADGALVDGPVSITGRRATYTFDATDEVQVLYRLNGAVERSDSAAGRALALATSLNVQYQPRVERETREVRAPEVLSLACSPTPEASPVPCGVASGDNRWRVELTGRQVVSRVLAQLTLE